LRLYSGFTPAVLFSEFETKTEITCPRCRTPFPVDRNRFKSMRKDHEIVLGACDRGRRSFMAIRRFVPGMLSVGLIVLGVGTACGQDYPSQPIRLVGSSPGGGSDLVMRLIAPTLRNALGQPVVIDNRPTILLGEIGSKAPPDGYTVIVVGNSFYIGHLLRETPWDPVRDFLPVTLADAGPSVLIVHPSLPVKSVKELIALAKARPKQLNFATGAPGSTAHLAAELFKGMAGINMIWVPYKDNGPGMMSVIAGETQLIFKDAAGVLPQMKAGRVRGLAVTSAQPSPLFPGLPPIADAGLPGYEALTTDAIVVPARTPTAIVNRLNEEIVRALNEANTRQTLFNSGVVVVGSSPEEFGAFLKASIAKWSKVIKDAGMRVN
jgi:tripartite-type tricarboxylate transporter receptor subunit TctC